MYNVRDAYIENRILSSSPIELACLLYEAAIRAVRDARHQLARGEIRERSSSISRACEIIAELTGSLDHNGGGEISRNLGHLYAYMHGRLIEANVEQSDPPLAEVLALLTTLAEGWDGVKAANTATRVTAPVSASPWAAGPACEAVEHAWSF